MEGRSSRKVATDSSSDEGGKRFVSDYPDVDPQERHQAVLEAIEEGYVEVDLRGNTVFWNESFQKIIGYPEDELFGLSYREYMSKEMSESVYEAYNKVFRTGAPNKAFTYEIIRKDGEKRIIENSISLVRDAEGHRSGFRSVVRDITERKKTEEELEKHRSRLQAIFRSVKDAIITVNREGVIIEANDATKITCGVERREVVGKALLECFSECSRACVEVLNFQRDKESDIRGYRIECRREDRPKQVVVVTSSPLVGREGEFAGTVLVIRDITRLNSLEQELRERHHFHRLVGKSSSMQAIYSMLEDLADLDTTVLVTGESGTGKSLVAKAIHYSGARAFKPVVTVNCAALPEALLESELFGHVKGAFTGAIRESQGRFSAAEGGTVILDEIGDVSARIQLKLLRVLEEKEFERVGDSSPIRANVRIIACTNRNLREKVRLGEFREDLYYRLKVVEIKMPPLRERVGDIPMLVEHFCAKFNKGFNKTIEAVSDSVLKAFLQYRWPGNVRELEHSLEHAYVLCRGPIITLDHIPHEIAGHSGSRASLAEKRTQVGRDEICEALKRTAGNKAKASRLLGIDRSTLYRRIKNLRVDLTDAV